MTYLSHWIQNVFIGRITRKTQQTIFDKVRKAKYFSITFDGTPDIFWMEQISQVLRYVEVSKGRAKVVESLVYFIDIHPKIEAGIKEVILEKLKKR